MTPEALDKIRSWDKRCGDNEGTFFPVTLDRRRLLEYVDELRAELALLIAPHAGAAALHSSSSNLENSSAGTASLK